MSSDDDDEEGECEGEEEVNFTEKKDELSVLREILN